MNNIGKFITDMKNNYKINPQDTLKTYNECMNYMINQGCYFGNEKEIEKMSRRFLEPIEMYQNNKVKIK